MIESYKFISLEDYVISVYFSFAFYFLLNRAELE